MATNPLRVLVGTLIALDVFVFFAYTFLKPFPFNMYDMVLAKVHSKISIDYFDIVDQLPGKKPYTPTTLGGEWAFEIIFQWGTTLLAVLLTLWYRNIPKTLQKTKQENADAELAAPLLRQSSSKKFKVAMKRILYYNLPPRGFFSWLCDGLTVMDLLLVLTWLFMNFIYVYFYGLYRVSRKAGGPTSRAQYTQDMMQIVARIMGQAVTLNMLLLFYPLSRSSFIHWWLGTDFPSVIKYHRWMGHGLMWILTLHGVGYLCVYASQDILSTQIIWSTGAGVNRLAGVISWASGVLLWVCSCEFVRRRYFELFYRAHIAGFIGFMAFGFMHWKDLWVSTLPGLLLYVLDVTFRCMQMMHVVHIQRFAISPDRSLATLHFDYAELQEKAVNPDQIMFLHVPSISRVQWHPFTVAAEPVLDGRGSATSKAHIKSYGKWTQSMISQLLKKGGLTARVDGPYGGHAEPAWVGHNVLAIFAGGIGVTPVLAMLRDIIARRAHYLTHGVHGDEGAPPEKVFFVFAARSQAELDLVSPTLSAALGEGDWLDVQLYYTGGDVAKAQAALAVTDIHDVAGAVLPASTDPNYRKRLVQPQQFGDLHLALATILSLGGGLGGGVLAYGWAAYIDLHTTYGVSHWIVGVWSLVFTVVGAMAVPALIIFPGHIYRALGCRAATEFDVAPSSISSSDLSSMVEPEEAIVSIVNVEGGLKEKDGSKESGITLLGGRPNVTAILSDITSRYQDQVEICVAAAGPDALVSVVGDACHAHNDRIGWAGTPYVDFHKQAFSL